MAQLNPNTLRLLSGVDYFFAIFDKPATTTLVAPVVPAPYTARANHQPPARRTL